MLKRLVLVLMLVCAVSLTHAQQSFTVGDVTYTVELVTRANYPVVLTFAPDGRLFYTEKVSGNVRVINTDGTLQREPVINFTVSALQERGLLGLAFDPNYAENGHVWVFYTAEGTARDYPENRVVRFTESGGVGTNPETMLAVPITTGSLIHNGGNLHFGADGYLYVSFGDYDSAANSQDLTTIPGKLHRFAVSDEGLVPAPENPFEGSSIYAYGLRNSFDFDFHPDNSYVYATENGLHCDDEINVLLPGFNYGAGENYECGQHAQGIDTLYYIGGLLSFTPTQSPTGIVVYDHEAVPSWYGSLLFCVWNDGFPSLRRVVLDDTGLMVEEVEELPLGDGRCRIDITIAPDGSLYFTSVDEQGGAIWRLVPQG